MTSLPANFQYGAHRSRSAIASYHRSQVFAAESTVVWPDSDDEFDDYGQNSTMETSDEERQIGDTTAPSRLIDDDVVGDLELNDDSDEQSGMHNSFDPNPDLPRYQNLSKTSATRPPLPSAISSKVPSEQTALLPKILSFNTGRPFPRRHSTPAQYMPTRRNSDRSPSVSRPSISKRRSSTSSALSGKLAQPGQSTFGQTLFNSIAALLGIGMLSEPLAFAYSGWVVGTIIIIFYGFISCYTAKILARIILSDPRIRTYADIGRKAFGPASMTCISFLFCLELFSVSVILVTLYADSLHTIVPQYSATTYKLWGSLLLIPMVFLPLSLLSYTSILGIISTVLIIFVVLIDGFTKRDAPGSFWSPAETSLGTGNSKELGLAFGLFMAGFAGHGVIPSLARDMADPTQFDKMINWAFVVATFCYALIGWAGYLMFGNSVSEEVSLDLSNTPGYNPALNKIVLWMLVISPLSKFALTTYPLNATIDGLLASFISPKEDPIGPDKLSVRSFVKKLFNPVVFQRIGITLFSIMFSILIPEFSSMMAFLGAFSAFILCVILPIAAKITLLGRCGVFDTAILGVGIVNAIWGTVAAFSSR